MAKKDVKVKVKMKAKGSAEDVKKVLRGVKF